MNPNQRKISTEEDDSELPTMNMLKYTSSTDKSDFDSGRIPQKLDENLVQAIMSQEKPDEKKLTLADLINVGFMKVQAQVTQ